MKHSRNGSVLLRKVILALSIDKQQVSVPHPTNPPLEGCKEQHTHVKPYKNTSRDSWKYTQIFETVLAGCHLFSFLQKSSKTNSYIPSSTTAQSITKFDYLDYSEILHWLTPVIFLQGKTALSKRIHCLSTRKVISQLIIINKNNQQC